MQNLFFVPLLSLAIYIQSAPLIAAGIGEQDIIDTHFHAPSNQPGGLDRAVEWLDDNGVSRAIDHPIGDSRPKNATERENMLANFEKHSGRFARFTIIYPEEVNTIEEAVKILEHEKAEGAIGFGEHYGKGLMFDDPANMRLYAACAQTGLPVMFHMDGSKNKDTADFKHLENALRTHPGCIFIAHGPNWWKQLGSGNCSRLLETYPNLYADLSAGSGARALSRDKAFTTEFMKKHHKKLLFGTDCGWWSFKENTKPAPQFALMRELDLSPNVKADIYRENAKRIFSFK